MRAIIQTGGKQFTVAPSKTIRVPTLAGEPGDTITFERVLYVNPESGDADDVQLGAPGVAGATVTGEIVKHGRGKKIVVFKYKKRKRYSRKTGHRQNFTELKITGISVDRSRTAKSEKAAKPSETVEGEDTPGTFTCEICGNAYDTERGLAMHVSRSHKDQGE